MCYLPGFRSVRWRSCAGGGSFVGDVAGGSCALGSQRASDEGRAGVCYLPGLFEPRAPRRHRQRRWWRVFDRGRSSAMEVVA